MRRLASALLAIALAAPLAACGAVGAPGSLAWRLTGGAAAQAARKPTKRTPGAGHLPGELKLHILPEATDAFVLQAIAGAKTSVKLQVYLLTHQGVIDALGAAKRRGVLVQVMLEEKPYNPGNPSNPLPTNKIAAKKLLEVGVASRWTNPTFKYTHAKAITIDDAVTFVSTANFTKSGLGVGGKGAREYVLEDRSPSDVSEFVAMFAADWDRREHQVSDPDLVISPTTSRPKIFELIRSAKKSVTIQVEVAGDPALDELIAAKVREGVKVRALLANLGALKHGKDLLEGLDAPHRSNQDVAASWIKAGAEVRWQETPHLHAKVISVDGARFYAGSVNLTSNSIDNNREIGLIVETPDLVSRIGFVLEQDWAHGEAIVPAPPAKKPGKRPGVSLEFPGLPE